VHPDQPSRRGGPAGPARAPPPASDPPRTGRPRSLDERLAEIEAVTADDLRRYVADRRPGPFTLATIGPRPLELPGE